MKERPILFSSQMVRAILDGRKTQTRRVVKPQPMSVDEVTHKTVPYTGGPEFLAKALRCPYGQPGDRLWVRETWAAPHRYDGHGPSNIPVHDVRVHYAASEDRGGLLWRPSIHMPRWASRINLEITGVRVERLQDISEADALAEGVESLTYGGLTTYRDYSLTDEWAEVSPMLESPIESYRTLWESINGPGSWDSNPWVWVVEFKKVDAA